MYTSVRWLNDYLNPPASAVEQAELLTRAGFPLEGSEEVAVSDGKDVRQDFEMTSNRGDCVCHLGLAREIAAISGRSLRVPTASPKSSSARASSVVKVTNREPRRCPLYTARIIRGATVKPSPAWLADRLRARGDIPRNNVVDATNFVLFELGQPTHIFDLAKLRGPEIIVRMAKANEPFLPIGEGEREVKLSGDDLVIADAGVAVAIAGVKGGALSAVTESTTDLLLEAASFDPVCVRNTSRRLGIASDSSFRFERGVHPAQVHAASERLAAIILDLAGGELCAGVVEDGAPIPDSRSVSMRISRCRAILGVDVPDDRILDALDRLGYQPKREGDSIRCIAPCFRLDIEREIDLIEEVARMHGLDRIPIEETLLLRVAPRQPREMARQAVAGALTGMSFVETVTHSLVSESAAGAFLRKGEEFLRVDDERSGAEPALRPSILPSLLRVCAFNRNHGAGEVRLFEQAATFIHRGGEHEEEMRLALLHPADDSENPLRETRGVIDRLFRLLRGPNAKAAVVEARDTPWLDPCASVEYGGERIGTYGLVARRVLDQFDVEGRMCAAELVLPSLYDVFPPETEAHALPAFPPIERDLSIIVGEDVKWESIAQHIDAMQLEHQEDHTFLTTFRGKQIGSGRKSVSFRVRFRASDRTLRHEEVSPQMDALAHALATRLGAEIRK